MHAKKMRSTKARDAFNAVFGVLLAWFGLCTPSWAQAAAADRSAIKVGAISTLALFPESTAAVKAYFDMVNSNGGIQGRHLVLLSEDDGGAADRAAAAARQLASTQVVANIGGASTVECSANAAFYREEGLISIPGIGVDPMCFEAANIAPVNVGPYAATGLGLEFLGSIKHRDRICVVTVAYAELQKTAFESEVSHWSTRSGIKLVYQALGVRPDVNMDGLIANIKSARCQGVVFTATAIQITAWMQAVKRGHVGETDWVFLTPAYTREMADALPEDLGPVYAMSEFEPWTSRSGMLSDWRQIMVRGKVPLTSLSQGGYAAAAIFVHVLRGIQGEITRSSVTHAFKNMQAPLEIPLLGMPYMFGSEAHHNANRAAIPVQLEEHRWRVAYWEYITEPNQP